MTRAPTMDSRSPRQTGKRCLARRFSRSPTGCPVLLFWKTCHLAIHVVSHFFFTNKNFPWYDQKFLMRMKYSSDLNLFVRWMKKLVTSWLVQLSTLDKWKHIQKRKYKAKAKNKSIILLLTSNQVSCPSRGFVQLPPSSQPTTSGCLHSGEGGHQIIFPIKLWFWAVACLGSTKILKIALTLKSEQPLPRYSTVVVKKGNLDIAPKTKSPTLWGTPC